jgi:hypothetical protein
MPEGVVAGLISGGITLVGSLGAMLIWFGYHKRRHEDGEKTVSNIEDRLLELETAHNARTANCPIKVVETRQVMVLECISDLRDELKSLGTKVDRMLGFLEARDHSNLNINK